MWGWAAAWWHSCNRRSTKKNVMLNVMKHLYHVSNQIYYGGSDASLRSA